MAIAFCWTLSAPLLAAQTHASSRKRHAAKSVSKAAPRPPAAKAAAPSDAVEKQLARLARALRDDGNAAGYAALSAFARRNAKNELGARAALALGYYDLTGPRERPETALGWLRKAEGDTLLLEYVQYWQAQALLAAGQKEDALAAFLKFLRENPDSVMAEPAIASMVPVALDLDKGEDALAALAADPNTPSKPALLLLRAQAEEKIAAAKGEKPAVAAADYLNLYYRFPLNDESKAAGQKIPSLEFALGEQFPGTPLQTQIARAETLFVARRWSDARTDYTNLLPKLSGHDHERAQLRVAVCDVELGGSLNALSTLSFSDPDVEAERLFDISQYYRSEKVELQMLDDIDQLTRRFRGSSWASDGLFATGNYYWVNMDRDRAADYYRRSLEAGANGGNSQAAAWRVAWTAYLDRKPEAADLIEDYVRRFPTSSYIQDALYWLGRS
ncbi:MAG: hypothetical protein ACRD4Y_02775, partial [Candidatus Acidiferrales bacterium]